MRQEQGSISLFVIAGVAMLILSLQLGMTLLGGSLRDEEEYLRERQLRLLTMSAAQKFADVDLEAGTKHIQGLKLYPGGAEVSLTRKNMYSQDACFRYLEAQGQQGELSYWLRRTTFLPPQPIDSLKKSYMFICKGAFNGAEFLQGKNVQYTSGEEVCFPCIDFLTRSKNKYPCRDTLDIAEVEKHGLGRYVYYLQGGSRSFVFPGYVTIHGTAVIAAEKGIKLEDTCTFVDPVILLANGPCRIGNKVELHNVFIMAKGPISIGSSCIIKGVLASCQSITLLGESTLIHDPSAMTHFHSVFSNL